jgi:D-alanine-D-alanine ligase
VGVLGNAYCDPLALPIIEIIPKSDFYHFENKYSIGAVDYVVPALISDGETKLCQKLAIAAHNAVGAQGYSRSDLRLRPDSRPVLLEINTLPGLTDTSLIPQAAASAGIAFTDLLNEIIENAISLLRLTIMSYFRA